MQNDQIYSNYFNPQYVMNGGPRTTPNNCTIASSSSIHNGVFQISPRQSIRAQKSFEGANVHSSFPFEQTLQHQQQQRRQVSPNRRSVQVDSPQHLINSGQLLRNTSPKPLSQLVTATDPIRTNYRAPLLKSNGRSLSARDSQEEFEKMNGHQHLVCAKRLLPVVPRATSPQYRQYISNRKTRLSVDANIGHGGGLEILEHRLQHQLALNESLFQKNKDKSPTSDNHRYTKRAPSPNLNEQCVDTYSPPALSPNNLNSPKRFTDSAQKLLQGCSRRLNFQRCHQKSFMGQEASRPTSKSSFSNSFDSSTVHCRSNVALANIRADSTASEDGSHELHLSPKTVHASSTGSLLQVDSNSHTNKQKRSMNDLYSSAKPLRSSNTLAPNTKSNKTNGRLSKKNSHAGISNASQSIINFCVENAKGDIATRVIGRMINKRDDFNMFIANLSSEQYAEFVASLREYFTLVVQHLQSTDKIMEISANYGVEQVSRRCWGFKADFFAVMAAALTTECIFLDGATHQPTSTIEAWSELITIMFEYIRNGYYEQVRFLRKTSHCFNASFNQSGEFSNEETSASNTPNPTQTNFN